VSVKETETTVSAGESPVPIAGRVAVFDTTLRDGEQSPGAALNVHEKVEIAHALEDMGVDVIEAGFPISSPGDFRAVQRISREIRNCTVCGLTRANRKDIDAAAEALRGAARPRIHTGLGVSDVHIRHKLRTTREEALVRAVEAVRYARNLVGDVQYYAEDAGRAEPAYLYRVVEAVIDAGATVVNIPDTTGYATPEEFGALIGGILDNVPNAGGATISVHCHNDLGMATANTLAAVRAGARQVEVTVNGIGERAGNCSLEEVVMALATRRDTFPVQTGIDPRRIYPISRLVSQLTGVPVQPNKAIVGANAFAHSSGIHQDGVLKERTTYEIIDPRDVGVPDSEIVLSARSGRAGLRHRLGELGYDLDEEQFEKVYERFLAVADKKKTVDTRDLEAIVADEVQVFFAETFHLEQVQVSCGDRSIPTATVRIRGPEDQLFCDADHGAGPVDAVYRAINRVIGEPNELIEFSIQAVTEGIDAVGRVTIRIQAGDPVRDNGYERRVFSGRASDTDIVVAAAKAYMFALNRLIAARREAEAQPSPGRGNGQPGAERHPEGKEPVEAA
jgi:2-isopropylmalate synthase